MLGSQSKDRGNREYVDIFITLIALLASMLLTFIFKEEISALGGFSFILKLFFGVCIFGILFRKLTTNPNYRGIDNSEIRHEKSHYRHVVYYYIMEVITLLIAPAMVGLFLSGMYIQIGS